MYPTGVVERYEYDAYSEPNVVVTTGYVYDSRGHIFQQIQMPDVNDANTWQTTTHNYNALARRVNTYEPDNIADYGGISRKTEYGYDRLGRQTSITGYADGSTAQTTTYTYDKLDRITNVQYPDGNDIEFTYNAAGKVTRREDQRGIVTTYSYDGTYRLLSKSVDGNSVVADATETFTRDGLGRILTAEKTVDSNTVSQLEYAYNDIGKVTDANQTLFGGTKRPCSTPSAIPMATPSPSHRPGGAKSIP